MNQPGKSKLPSNLFTIYGRKPVLEALNDDNIEFFRIHLAKSNRDSDIIDKIIERANQRRIDIAYHDRLALSRISKNKKQDQGVAADILATHIQEFDQYLQHIQHTRRDRTLHSILALDNITNPQNLGMIIRSACAGYTDAVLLPRKGCARLDPLVIKASAGTLFKARLMLCDTLAAALQAARQVGFAVYGLDAASAESLMDIDLGKPHIFVLGNETEGLSTAIRQLCDHQVKIPMRNSVESLNVGVTAGILSFLPLFRNEGIT